jgi:hypothetical protein
MNETRFERLKRVFHDHWIGAVVAVIFVILTALALMLRLVNDFETLFQRHPFSKGTSPTISPPTSVNNASPARINLSTQSPTSSPDLAISTPANAHTSLPTPHILASESPARSLTLPTGTNIVVFNASSDANAIIAFCDVMRARFPTIVCDWQHKWKNQGEMPNTVIYFVQPEFAATAQALADWLPGNQYVVDYSNQTDYSLPFRNSVSGYPYYMVDFDSKRNIAIFLGDDFKLFFSKATAQLVEEAHTQNLRQATPGQSGADLNFTPKKIIETIKSRRLSSEIGTVKKAFVGLPVDWTLLLVSASRRWVEVFDGAVQERMIVHLRSGMHGDTALVTVDLPVIGNERLPLADETQKFRVQGNIKEIQTEDIIVLKSSATLKPVP